jgi:hypothetical protein
MTPVSQRRQMTLSRASLTKTLAGMPRVEPGHTNSTVPIRGGESTPRYGFLLVLWCLQIILSPIYVFESGLPQPADFLLVFLGLLAAVFVGINIPTKALQPFSASLVFACYTFAVNLWWFIRLGQLQFLIVPLYYFYNCFALLTFWNLYHTYGRSFIYLTTYAIFASVVIQLFISFQVLDNALNNALRTSLFFRNPNQTAYYAILVGSLILTASQGNLLPAPLKLLTPLFFAALAYLVILTQSRGGLAALGVLFALFAIRRVGTALILGLVLFTAAHSSLAEQLLQSVAERMEAKKTNLQQELAYRGYARIWENPQYLLFGAGEGGYERFETLWGKELHSTFGNVLMSYGVVGLLLLLRFFWSLVRISGFTSLLNFLPAFVFGLTHNGIRQSEFWMIAALSLCRLLESRWPAESSPKFENPIWGRHFHIKSPPLASSRCTRSRGSGKIADLL